MISHFSKRVAILNCAMPAFLLMWDGLHNDLGANPVNFAIRTTGILSIIFLLVSLAVTPLMRMTGWSWLGTFRRTAGVSAFAYAALHFGIYFGFDRAGNIGDTLSEIISRQYLLIGIIGLSIMLPLAITSSDSMIRRLGAKRWKSLHRFAYIAAIAGAIHFFLLVKADTTRPLIVAAILFSLLVWRIGTRVWQWYTDSIQLRTQKQTALKPKTWTGKLRISKIFAETPNVKTFRFVMLDGSLLPFEALPGQYLILSLMIEGRPVRRSYTIASPPSRNHSVEITVKREETGLVSRYLHDKLGEGDVVSVTAPAGRFTFTGQEADSILLIAGGVGITPLMAKIRYLTDQGWPGRIHLVVSSRTETELIFRSELEALTRKHLNLTMDVTLTREDSPNWAGRRGRISESWLLQHVGSLSNCRIHLCGPTEMTGPLIATLTSAGVASERIHEESFTSPSRQTSAPSVSTVTFNPQEANEASLEFSRTGRTVGDLKGRTILEIAEEHGVRIPYDCRAAVCGQCKTRVLSGTVAMDADDALNDNDRANGTVLACQARCVDQVVIDI